MGPVPDPVRMWDPAPVPNQDRVVPDKDAVPVALAEAAAVTFLVAAVSAEEIVAVALEAVDNAMKGCGSCVNHSPFVWPL